MIEQMGSTAALRYEAVRPTAADPARDRVLIVDDNEINRRVLRGMLRREAVDLTTAADGDEALERARREAPQLILLDIMMPAKNGYQVCAELKADPRTEHIPVIFLSALSETADKIKGLELGAVDYITKPFDQGEVLARVRSQLKIQRLTHDLRAANRALQDKQAHLDEDLRAAAVIQRSLMPVAPPAIDGLRLAARFEPCEDVGGDLFHFVPLPGGELAAYVLDVSGHGVPAAMVTVSLSQFLSGAAHHLIAADGSARAPAEVLELLEREYPLERFDKYLTMAYALIDPRRGRLRYSAAGHPAPLLLLGDSGRVERLECGGPLIGMGTALPFEEGEVALCAGDRLWLFTDGLTEQADAGGVPFGDERLAASLQRAQRLPLAAACDAVLQAAHAFSGGAAVQDDITLVGVEFVGGCA